MKTDYRMQVLDSMSTVSAMEWNALLPTTPGSRPFLTHEYLNFLETTGCVGSRTGWQAQHLVVRNHARELVAAAPLYLKEHSYGEYVFDWSWADAYRRNGLQYYPKLLSAIPFTPITGPRLLAIDPSARRALIKGMVGLVSKLDVSSLHLLYPQDEDWPDRKSVV